MNTKTISIICDQYNLGNIISESQKLTGSLVHKVWRVRTDKGEYLFKKLNKEIKLNPKTVENLNLCEKGALEFKNKGISSVPALSYGENQFVFEFNNNFYIVLPWIDGTILKSQKDVDIITASKMGLILARLHRANLHITKNNDTPDPYTSYSQWVVLEKQVKALEYNWVGECIAFIKTIKSWYYKINLANINLHNNNNIVFSHRYLTLKNVIWDNYNEPNIIYWETAGFTNPVKELMQFALDWSENEIDFKVDKLLFTKIIRSYSELRYIDSSQVEDALYSVIGDVLEWLKFSLNRVVKKRSKEDCLIAQEQVMVTIKLINSRLKNAKVYIEWMQNLK
jgi:thiamine kinase-like enzyme